MPDKLVDDLKASVQDNHLPCPVAWQLSKKHNVSKKRVGETADELKIRIVNCQLGCFGVAKATHEELAKMEFPDLMSQEIKASLNSAGNLTCETAFALAKKLKLSPRLVGDAASKMHIHVSDCQLGCF